MLKVAIGQDSHRFELNPTTKKLILGGVIFENEPALEGNSDADVILHAITNAISGITCVNILGEASDNMCKNGKTDSKYYIEEALKYLKGNIQHISISIECLKPQISPKIEQMRKSIANLLKITNQDVGITATSGEGLTDFGKGLGISCFACITVEV